MRGISMMCPNHADPKTSYCICAGGEVYGPVMQATPRDCPLRENLKHAGELHMSWPKKGGQKVTAKTSLLVAYHPFFFLNAWTSPLLALNIVAPMSGRMRLIPHGKYVALAR